jgi:chemotaxis protein MotB
MTFSDMVTLLLSFFIVLAAMSSLSATQYQRVAQSMAEAMGSAETARERVAPDEVRRRLEALVAQANVRDDVSVEVVPRGIALNVKGSLLFPSGSAELLDASRPVLDRLHDQLKDAPYIVIVEGHTDNVPIQSAQFPSNWELSAARASRVVRFFAERGIPAARLRAVGLADTQPVAPNTAADGTPLPENQARNRRVVLLLAP